MKKILAVLVAALSMTAAMAVDAIRKRINPLDVEHYQQLVQPDWYDT